MADENNTTANPKTKQAETIGKGKTSRKVMIAVGVAAVIGIGGIGAFAGGAHSSGWGSGMGHGHGYSHGYGHGQKGHMMKMFQEFDADDDGRISSKELDDGRMSKFSGADGNGNGVLSLDEFQNLWMTFMRPRMVDKFQMLDEDGDGAVTQKEFAMPFNMVMRHMDRNHDGVLEMREIKRKRHWGHDDHDDDYDDDDDDRYERDDD